MGSYLDDAADYLKYSGQAIQSSGLDFATLNTMSGAFVNLRLELSTNASNTDQVALIKMICSRMIKLIDNISYRDIVYNTADQAAVNATWQEDPIVTVMIDSLRRFKSMDDVSTSNRVATT